MTDAIVVRGIRARGYHGVLEHEKRDGQDFVVDVTLAVDLVPAGESDDLGDTVDYAAVAAEVVAQVGAGPYDLIETLAARIASAALARPLVEAVDVVVHKPEAPVGVAVDDVEVHIRRERRTHVVVAVGANLGDRVATVAAAIADLPLTQARVSPLYETDPVGGPEQPRYVNAVVAGVTSLAPATLLRRLHEIEAQYGRTREVRWGARTLDLDLIAYGTPGGDEATSDAPGLTLPHPRAFERAFVLAPWADIEPDARLRLPSGELRRVRDRLEELDRSGVHRREDRS